MEDITFPVLKDIRDAYNRISPFIHRTPVLTSSQLNSLTGSELYFKCENFQKIGAFKFRGALNAVMRLTPEQRKKGVVTHSSGNHAAALALAARINGIKANIVMPDNSSEVKKNAVISYGAEITYCESTLESRITEAEKIVDRYGANLIHPYDNFDVICGQGTAALELLEDYKELDMVICPVGGGGLLSGTATQVKGLNPGLMIYAGEPEQANDAYRSFKSGELVTFHTPDTISEGLRTLLSKTTFSIIREKVDDIFTVSEKSTVESMRLIWERMKIIIEPSSAVALAAIWENPDIFRNKKVGVILTGGNVDLNNLPF